MTGCLESVRLWPACVSAALRFSCWPAAAPASQLNLGEPELALQSMERVLQLAPGHPEAAAEVVSIRTLVLQRRQGGGGDDAAGQRARVLPGPSGGGASDAMES